MTLYARHPLTAMQNFTKGEPPCRDVNYKRGRWDGQVEW